MTPINFRVLQTLADDPHAVIRDEDEKNALAAMAFHLDRPVTDVYEAFGGMIGRITEAGRRMLRADDKTFRVTVRGDCGPHASVKEWQDCPKCAAGLRRALGQ